jgi:hypothetical protein
MVFVINVSPPSGNLTVVVLCGTNKVILGGTNLMDSVLDTT